MQTFCCYRCRRQCFSTEGDYSLLISPIQDAERMILPSVGHYEFSSSYKKSFLFLYSSHLCNLNFNVAILVGLFFKTRLNRLIVFLICSFAVITGQTHIYDALSIFLPSRDHQPISLYYLSSSKRMHSSVLFGFSAVILQKQRDWSTSLTP